MHARLGRALIIIGFLALAPTRADAQVSDDAQCGTSLPACTALRTSCCTRDFSSTATQKAILIPTDRCHQPFTSSTPNGGPDIGDAAPKWCASSPGASTNSQTYVYGLIYRLMQNKIPVYWIVNPTKAPTTYGGITPTSTAAGTKDVDFWILSSTAST
ncbi:MAG TPA: hypothetical protein VK427_13240, partial [Kofleriaceae bacterium]|nr:hypothetical protein [Kofleriaceae bacterium]